MNLHRQFIFWGATGQAKVLRECLKANENLVALFDNNPKATSPFPDVPLSLGWDGFTQWQNRQPKDQDFYFLVAVGGDLGKERLEIQDKLENLGLMPGSACHESAVISKTAHLSAGCQILANATIGAGAVLGRACIVNTAASVDHECILADGVHISPGACLAGCVSVGKNSMIGTGAVILPRIKIGSNSVIGAGAVVIKDVPNNVIVVGNPARVLKERNH